MDPKAASGAAPQPGASEPASEACTPDLHIAASLLGGVSVTVAVPVSSTVGDLRVAVGAGLGLRPCDLRLVQGDEALTDLSALLLSTGLVDNSCVSVVKLIRPTLVQPPNKFELSMLSARERCLGAAGARPVYSSAFTVHYLVKGDLTTSTVTCSMVRRNDTDKTILEGRSGRRTQERGHWMAGTQTTVVDGWTFELSEVLREWMDKAEMVDSTQRLWREASELKGQADEQWFLLPSEDCVELRLEAEANFLGAVVISRILVDEAGSPIRAALYFPRHGGARQKANLKEMATHGNASLEEYDVTLKALEEATA